MEFAKQTIEHLKKHLLIEVSDDSFALYYDNDSNETTFHLPVYELDFILHNGFWQIESNFHYCKIVMHNGHYFWLRQMIFDIVRALGQEEAWHAEEYYTWNGGNCEEPETTFEQWYEQTMANYGKEIPEFDQAAIIEQGDTHIPDYAPIYHDSFKECEIRFYELQARLEEYKLLGLNRIGNAYLRCEKEGKLFLINENTLKPLFNSAIDCVLQPLNGPEFIVLNNGLSAVFDENGKQLTKFVTGHFDWEWAPYKPNRNNTMERYIYNKEANIRFLV